MKKPSVLIIEDERAILEALKYKLLHSDFRVLVATDGVSGLRLAQQEKPDVILLDLILPILDGFSVLEKLKQDKNTQSISVIILSNLGQEEDMKKGKKLGAEDYLVKTDVGLVFVVDKIRKILKDKQLL